MLIAAFSDIYGNRHALEAVLQDIEATDLPHEFASYLRRGGSQHPTGTRGES